MGSLEGWMRSVVDSFENEAAEYGARLMQKDHPDAHRVCQKKFASVDGSVKCELDGVVVGVHCVLDIEAKTSLGVSAGKELLITLKKIRSVSRNRDVSWYLSLTFGCD